MSLVRPEDWVPQGIEELEDRAWEALRETDRSVCVTAGAGAGKTEFLAQKASYLLQTGLCPAPKRILAISFKRDAAETLSARVRKRCPEGQARRFVSLTFDAFAKGLVDQFRMAVPALYRPPANYEIAFPTNDALNDFLRRAGIHNINTQQLTRTIAGVRIGDPNQNVPENLRSAFEEYWNDQLNGRPTAYLTFPMINRLAEYLVRANPRIHAAIRMTYPVIFLDEFQDTQRAQFELLTSAFDKDHNTFTAVGDDKQRIMGWAGAMPNGFEVYTQAFDARPISLLLNWRSHTDLVAIQHIVAQSIDPNVEHAVARGEKAVDGDVCAIWDFGSEEEEIKGLAGWISEQVDDGVPAHELAVLVRNHPERLEKELGPALAELGVPLRNVARNVGSIAIQDLLAEELSEILLPLLRLGAEKRNPAAWASAQEQLRRLEAISLDDDLGLQRSAARTEALVKSIRAYIASHDPEASNVAGAVALLIEEIGETVIRRATPSYTRNADFARVAEGFKLLLSECLGDADSWSEALDRFEGRNQVPLMTIHKSKGMEFHTIVFFGLDSNSWWSLTPNRPEEMNSFFVALTRAKQRAFFTNCSDRGGRIAWLENLLGAHVPRIASEDIA